MTDSSQPQIDGPILRLASCIRLLRSPLPSPVLRCAGRQGRKLPCYACEERWWCLRWISETPNLECGRQSGNSLCCRTCLGCIVEFGLDVSGLGKGGFCRSVLGCKIVLVWPGAVCFEAGDRLAISSLSHATFLLLSLQWTLYEECEGRCTVTLRRK